jgi:hypothetical protein
MPKLIGFSFSPLILEEAGGRIRERLSAGSALVKMLGEPAYGEGCFRADRHCSLAMTQQATCTFESTGQAICVLARQRWCVERLTK